MKAKPGSFFGAKASRALSMPTFSVTSKAVSSGKSTAKRQVAVNVESLDQVAEESADRQRSVVNP